MIRIWTDGGCSVRRHHVGAWAFCALLPDGSKVEASAGCIGTTNNRMELLAVLKALEQLAPGVEASIRSDSQYVVRGRNEWLPWWLRQNWRTAAGAPVKNRDLWEAFVHYNATRKFEIAHVKGHAGDPFNERCDRLCTNKMHDVYRAFEKDPDSVVRDQPYVISA